MKNAFGLLILSLVIFLTGIPRAEAKKPKNDLDILTSTAWRHACSDHSGPIGSEIFFIFDKKAGRHLIYMDGIKFTDATFNYYLSDSPATDYNAKREGEVKKGQYITMRYTGFDPDTPMYGMLVKKGVNPNKPGPHTNVKITSLSPQELAIPSVGIDGVLVPCDDLEAAEARLAKIRQTLMKERQSTKQQKSKNPSQAVQKGKQPNRRQPVGNQ